MSGIFEELEMFDEGDKVATRQAIAAATKRFNDNFAGFLRQASTKKEFDSRLALVDTDIDNMVADVVTEYGGDAEKIASAVKETVKTAFTPKTPSADEPCNNCGGHGCEHCSDDPDASKTASEERPEHLKAQDEIQLAEEHSQVNPWLKKQIQDEDQEDGGNLRNKEANLEDSQPVANPVPLTKTEGHGGNIEKQLENAPSAVGKGKPEIPLNHREEPADDLDKAPNPLPAKGIYGSNDKKDEHEESETAHEEHEEHETAAEEKKEHEKGGHEYGEKEEHPDHKEKKEKSEEKPSGAHTVEKKNDKFVVVEDGGEEAAGPFDSQEEAYARANELNDLENLEKEASIKQAMPILQDQQGNAYLDQVGRDSANCNNCGQPLNAPGQHPGASAVTLHPDPDNPSHYLCDNCNKNWGTTASTTPAMQKALALKQAAATEGKRNFFAKDEWVNEGDTVTEDGEEKKVEDITQHGDEKVVELSDGSVADIDEVEVAGSKTAADVETGDKTEERESLPTGNEDANDGPSPKMDKTKWKPNATNPNGNLEPIKTEGENSPHPTRQMDIKQKPDYQQDTLENLEKYDNNVWEREELPTATEDEAGFEGTRNIDQPTKAAETFPDKGQANPVTREALAGNERVAIFEDERDILEKNVPEDYSPSREGIMSELADLKQRLIDSGSSPEEAEAEIKDLVMGMWRTEQSPEELSEIGIEDVRSEGEEIPAEDVELDTELTPEGASVPVEHNDTELSEEGASVPAEHDVDTKLTPEGASVPAHEIEDIIERGDDEGDRVEVIHDEEDEDNPLGFDDPDKVDEEDLDLDGPFDEELSDEELDKLLREVEEEYDDEDLFL